MKNIFRKILFGDSVIKEYSTVTINDVIREKVYLKTGNLLIDISENHWVLCLEPIVIGIWIENKEQLTDLDKKTGYRIYFKDSESNDEKNMERNAVAVLDLEFFDEIAESKGSLFLLRMRRSRISHLNFIQTILIYYKYYKKPHLSFKKLKSFVSAYSYPRRVRVVSFKSDDYYNILPMDLLGDISQCNRYVFGLRHTNIALSKIIETGKVVVSEISYEHKDIIYQLGKHHSSVPPSLDLLPFKVITSENFGFYIPDWVQSYKEIKIERTINLGSHMLIWGEVINQKILKNHASHLYHIHFLLYLHQKKKGFSYQLV
jgi:flavin reductase (DIM6/NTAB) family NADH-FMN oxidoreductase RutF